MKKILTTLFIITLVPQLIIAQNLNRANNLFDKCSYVAAAELFLEEEDKTQEILEKLGDCYYFNTDMSSASKWYKILMNEHFENNTVEPTYIFRYAQTLKGVSNFDDADIWYKIYTDAEKIDTQKNSTTSYFESLNNQIDRPYIAHKMSENSEGSEFGVFIQGNKVLFASTRSGGNMYDWNNQPYLDLYEATIDDDGNFTNTTALNSEVNTKMHESNGIITKDGQTLYFNRNNFISGKKIKDENKVTHLKIYKAQLVDGDWANVTELSFNSNTYSVIHPALNNDETQLYFSSDMPGSIGSFDLFVVGINSDGTFGTPKNLGPKINTKHREQFPFISSTNNLYFASDGHFGMGGLDIFKSKITSGSYGTPTNLSDIINSNLDDFAFSIDEEKEIGYFSSNRSGGKGDDDIYRFTQLKKYYVNGVAQNKNTLEILPGTHVALMDSDGNLISEMTTSSDAAFSLEIESNKNYTIKGSLKAYNPSKVSFNTDSQGNISKNILLMLELYEDAEDDIIVENEKLQIKINPIYFDFDKWNIRPDAAKELNLVVAIMKKYPDMVIEIGAHTDCRGSDDYNMSLSHKRAKSVREYLVENDITDANVQSKGYGETQPLNHCIKEGICKEKEYDINRRCEFVILN